MRRIVVLALAAALTACKRDTATAAGPEGTSSGLPSGAVPVTTAPAPPPARPVRPAGDGVQVGPLSFAPIARQADVSVVTIATVGEEMAPTGFFGKTRRRETKGLGTGFIIDKDGTILTNNHVVEGAGAITVKLSDDKEFPCRIVGRDPRTDIAVVKVDVKDHAPLVPLGLGDSDQTEVGDWVVAIGNPFGLSHTVSAGIISAKGRSRQDVPLDPSGYYNFLQTDASINPGNSGGPLLNMKGEVVGINSAVRAGGAQGIGFAIPINMVKQLLPMLEHDGHVTRSALGVNIRNVSELAPEDKAKAKMADDKGVAIFAVAPGGPADKAGLQSGDIILAFEGEPIERDTRLQWLASTAGVGKTVNLRVWRQGKAFDLKVTLGELPEDPSKKQRIVVPE